MLARVVAQVLAHGGLTGQSLLEQSGLSEDYCRLKVKRKKTLKAAFVLNINISTLMM